MTTISAQISDELYKSLNDVAKQLHRSSSYIIKEAITSYVEEIKEDIEAHEMLLRLEKEKINIIVKYFFCSYVVHRKTLLNKPFQIIIIVFFHSCTFIKICNIFI
jgi:predicted DNA-binding protein